MTERDTTDFQRIADACRQIAEWFAEYRAALRTLAGSFRTVAERKTAIAIRDEFEAGIEGHIGTLLDQIAALAAREPPQDESLAVAHARIQGAANGFQQGWRAALQRIREGDNVDDLIELVPEFIELHAETPDPSALEQHRCSGCGLRWEGELKGAELCGDCWRKAQPILHVDKDIIGTVVAAIAGQADPSALEQRRREEQEQEFTPEQLAELRADFEAWKQRREAPARELAEAKATIAALTQAKAAAEARERVLIATREQFEDGCVQKVAAAEARCVELEVKIKALNDEMFMLRKFEREFRER